MKKNTKNNKKYLKKIKTENYKQNNNKFLPPTGFVKIFSEMQNYYNK